MQYGFLETRPYSTQLRLKKQDLFNAVKIEETRPFQWCRHRRRRRWEKGRETGDGETKSISIKSIANLLNVKVFRFHRHWYTRSIYWLWLLLCHTLIIGMDLRWNYSTCKFGCRVLRYESSTLILYKELSGPIFQSCEWVSESVRHR